MGKGHKPANGAQDLLSNTARRKRVIRRDKFPNIRYVPRGEGVKRKALLSAH
jgi:hypothetical protein